MLVNERIQQPYWAFLYSQFLKQTDTANMKGCLSQLEFAICERRKELTGLPESYSHKERLAIEAAREKLLEIKTTRLGFPSTSARLVPGSERMRGNARWAQR